MTETLKQRIMRHEGLCQKPKYDAKGFYVIGYGHDIPRALVPHFSAGISNSTAGLMLDADIAKYTAQALKAFPFLPEIQPAIRQEVVIEMVFQLGLHGVLGFHKMLAALMHDDYATAADEMLDSDWARVQTPARAKELAEIMRTGKPL